MKYLKFFEDVNDYSDDLKDIEEIFQEYVDEYSLTRVISDGPHRPDVLRKIEVSHNPFDEYAIELIDENTPQTTLPKMDTGFPRFVCGFGQAYGPMIAISLNLCGKERTPISAEKYIEKCYMICSDMREFYKRLKGIGYRVEFTYMNGTEIEYAHSKLVERLTGTGRLQINIIL